MIQILAIRDRQLDAFMQPFCAQSVGMGLRAFTDLTNDNTSNIYKHPEDYELYHLGEVDETTGILSPVLDVNGAPKPKQIALATNVMRAPK